MHRIWDKASVHRPNPAWFARRWFRPVKKSNGSKDCRCVPNPLDPTRVQTMPMYGWQAAAQLNIMPNLFISGGYSTVTVCKKNGYYSPDEYKNGQYVFGNVFYHLTPRFQIAAEYLWAKRKNMNNEYNNSNRINMMVQYNF